MFWPRIGSGSRVKKARWKICLGSEVMEGSQTHCLDHYHWSQTLGHHTPTTSPPALPLKRENQSFYCKMRSGIDLRDLKQDYLGVTREEGRVETCCTAVGGESIL